MSSGAAAMKKVVQRKFKMRGYTLRVDALDAVISFASRFSGAEDDALDLLLDQLDHESLTSSIIDRDPVNRVVSLLLEAEAAAEESPNARGLARVVGDPRCAWSTPSWSPSFVTIRSRRSFTSTLEACPFTVRPLQKRSSIRIGFCCCIRDSLVISISRSLHSKLKRPSLEVARYLQSNLLSGKLDGDGSSISNYKEKSNTVVFFDKQYKITTGFFTENTIVVAEGQMLLEGIFKIFTCGFPPLEDRDKSLKALAGLDFFGGGTLTKEETLRLAELEKRAVNDMFIIMSDVWLDNEEAMGKLETVLDGFENEEVVPSLFVLMGNFCSRPCNLSFHSYSSIRAQFGKLGQMIESHPRLKEHSRFLFIPGPEDAGPSTVLPRCALPRYITEEFQSRIPNAIFSSNPCRIKFYTQEIVFFRQDLLYRMRRSCLMPPSTEETSDTFEHLVATITHQSHLCPLPLVVQPVIWNYDHSLHLYPTPHTIVLGDKSEQKAFSYTGITCFNPGSFSNDGTFVAYRPCTREVELSALPA
ncbi:hypothetical protein NL676_021995 [Syzygium grande]|nr:hypothetical protein NL676_021995 [Syzygium grande]